MAVTKLKNNGNGSNGTSANNGRLYGASDMVERHYVPARFGNLLPGERVEIESLAAAYRLNENGLDALARYMNTVAHRVHNVPPKANDVAKKFATIELPEPSKSKEPYMREDPEYDAPKTTFF